MFYSSNFLIDILSDKDENYISDIVLNSSLEGAIKANNSTRYERNPKNRKEAILFHGLNCQVCGFNFERNYGDLGKNFIEVFNSFVYSRRRKKYRS